MEQLISFGQVADSLSDACASLKASGGDPRKVAAVYVQLDELRKLCDRESYRRSVYCPSPQKAAEAVHAAAYVDPSRAAFDDVYAAASVDASRVY